jgi:hypothetical protein
VEKERTSTLLLNIILSGFAILTAVVTVWSLVVAFHWRTTAAIRRIAYQVFRVACTTFVVSTAAAIIQLYASGVL